VIVTSDVSHSEGVVVVGVDCLNRPGLLTTISEALLQLGLKHRHSEAEVFGDRSLSIWRCESDGSSTVERSEIWTVLSDLLHESVGATEGEEEWNPRGSSCGDEGFKPDWKGTW
jgi:UTP:GlnB (protein PII) uridylyltransferase